MSDLLLKTSERNVAKICLRLPSIYVRTVIISLGSLKKNNRSLEQGDEMRVARCALTEIDLAVALRQFRRSCSKRGCKIHTRPTGRVEVFLITES